MAGIKKRDSAPREHDPEVEARIAAFADDADPTPPPVTAASTGRARTTRRGSRHTRLEQYDDIATTYGGQFEAEVLPDFDDLPESILVKHAGSKEDALLIHLIAQAEDRSKAKVAQRALLDGLRTRARELTETGEG